LERRHLPTIALTVGDLVEVADTHRWPLQYG